MSVGKSVHPFRKHVDPDSNEYLVASSYELQSRSVRTTNGLESSEPQCFGWVQA